MLICPACAEENPPKFRLCGYCGAALAGSAPPPAPVLAVREMRKTVTIVFSDLKDSTALGERIDTEALHEVKERYFSAMNAEITRHGGKVEKYIGDAIMAVFGLPQAHEDDALRAARAALGMGMALDKLNQDLRQRYGVALANRTGINTGEVVANDDPSADQKLATGDAVNVAARLEQAAPVGQIYLGESTWRLVRDAVEVEAVAPLVLKGKAQPVAAYRLLAATGVEGNVRRLDTPLAGRDDELATLGQAWREASGGKVVRLVTVVGEAGLGKSRLIHEAVVRHGGAALVLRGRCLPYGDGITFWPLAEMVSKYIDAEASADEAQAALRELTGDADVAARLAAAIGLSTAAFPLHELNWAARRFLQGLARQQPVIALIDDIHWAEPAFLALIEHVLDAATDSPILLLATARHELLEEHPGWPERPNATQVVLRPLSDAAAAQVVANVLGPSTLAPTVVARIILAAEGNPLYVEQMLEMLAESDALGGGGAGSEAEIAVPPTIHALLEARLDRLPREQRAIVEPAAVVGVTFPQRAVESLSPQMLRQSVPAYLSSLRQKHFINAAESNDPEAVFRFHHHLIRDTIYNGLLKRSRATLHAGFVRWADQMGAELDRGPELEEILGYHLEQAHRYLSELGPLDGEGLALGADGSARLSRAARRAASRGDMNAAANLFGRAVALLATSDPLRLPLLPEWAEAMMELGDFEWARTLLDQVQDEAQAGASPRVKAAAQLVRLLVRLHSGEPGNWSDEALRLAEHTIPQLEAEGAHDELAKAWRLIALTQQIAQRPVQAREAIAKVITHARLAGNQRLLARSSLGMALSTLYGPTPVPEAITECEALLANGLGDRQVESLIQCKIAQLYAMRGDFVQARDLVRRGRAVLRELGQGVHAASTALDLVTIESLAGDLPRAEAEARVDYEFLERQGETFYLATLASLLARVVRDQGRDVDALALTEVAERTAADDDVDAQVLWRSARAPIVARAGSVAAAEAMAREALALARTTEVPTLLADALFELASVLAIAARAPEARAAFDEAAALYRAKGDVVSAARCQTRAAELPAA